MPVSALHMNGELILHPLLERQMIDQIRTLGTLEDVRIDLSALVGVVQEAT